MAKKERMEGADRISNLPDLVLSHILSFLSTKEAVRTSTLSTRWRKISSLLSNLSFEYYGWNYNESGSYNFMSFVDRVLFYRTGDVDKFHLNCGTLERSVDLYRVDGWIRYALLNRVREIDLQLHLDRHMEFYRLPLGIFTSETLVVLRLEISMTYGNTILKVPTKICFPNLKILRIYGFDLTYDYSIQRLFSSCVVLEEFVINRCIFPGKFNICNPTLKRLTITECYFGDYVILIDAPRLVYLKCDLSPSNLSLKNVNSLVEGCIDLTIADVPTESCVLLYRVIADLLEDISNVRSLHLSAFLPTEKSALTTKNNCTPLEDFLQDNSIVFELPKVAYLNLYVDSTGGWEGVLPHLLTWFPCLEELHVMVNEVPSLYYPRRLILPSPEFPPFLWSQLKTFRFGSFKGQKNEYQFAIYFLKSASVLEKLLVRTTKRPMSKTRLKTTKNLLRLPKASKKCIISVV